MLIIVGTRKAEVMRSRATAARLTLAALEFDVLGVVSSESPVYSRSTSSLLIWSWRLSFAASREQLQGGLDRLEAFLKRGGGVVAPNHDLPCPDGPMISAVRVGSIIRVPPSFQVPSRS